MEWFMKCLKQYADFEGRARRKEYWMYSLFAFIAYIIAIAIDAAILGGMPVVYSVTALGLLVPSLAVSIRRLHDIGKSGWYLLVAFIPLIGGIWLLILLVTAGNEGENEYGEDPKALEAY